MNRYRDSVIIALLCCSAPASAVAQEIPCGQGPCVRARERGTHFLAEANGGGTLVGGQGVMVGGLFGAGGTLRWLRPFRFYLITEFSYSTSTDEGFSPTLGTSFRDERARRDIAGGLRVYLPIYGPVRLFGDILGGGTYLTGHLIREGSPLLAVSGWEGLAVAAAGAQVRIITQLSLGLRARFTLTEEAPDGLRATMRANSTRPISFMAGMTWHF